MKFTLTYNKAGLREILHPGADIQRHPQHRQSLQLAVHHGALQVAQQRPQMHVFQDDERGLLGR